MYFFYNVPENGSCCGCTGRFRLSAWQSCPTMDMTQETACSIFFNLGPWWSWVIGFTPGETFPSVHWIGSWAVPRGVRNALKMRKSLVSAGNYNTNPPSSASILVIYDEKQCAKETVYRQARVVTRQYNIVLFTCIVQIQLNNLCWGIL